MPNKNPLFKILCMKINVTLFILPFLLINWSISGQVNHEWSFSVGSKDSEGQGRAFADHAGNIYSLLQMKDSVDIDPGPGVEHIVPEFGESYILTKNDEEGNLVFGYPFQVDKNSYGYLTEVAQNQIRVSFYFTDSLIYVRNGLREKLYSQPGKHNAILTLDLDGKIIDSYYFPTPEAFYFNSFYTLPDGKVLMTGAFSGSFPLSTQPPIYSGGFRDGFIMMADQNFNPIWVSQFKGTGHDYVGAMFVRNEQHIYFTAAFDDTLSLVTLQGPITKVSTGDPDGLFGYLNLNGDIEKVFFIEGDGYQDTRDIASDASGNMYICGEFENTVNFASALQAPHTAIAVNESDGYVAKYDPIGNLVWLGLYPNDDAGGTKTVDLKRGNELYINGYFSGKGDLNPGPDSLIVQTGYHSSPFISKLTTDGEFLWAIPFITNEVAGIQSLMINTETSRIVANGFFYDSIHCSEIPGENWLGTPYGADCFLICLSEENVVTATHDQVPLEIGVYPNPTSGQVHINAEHEIKQVSVQSFDGKLIGTWNFTPSEHQEIDLHDLPSGMYYMSIQSGDQWSTEKIVIQ
jgi:hypothetical protein